MQTKASLALRDVHKVGLCPECYAAGKSSTRPLRRDGIRQMLRRVKELGATKSTRYAFTECDVSYWLGVARRG